MKIGFLIRPMPYTYESLDTAYHLAEAALDAGHSVRIFLYEDAVVGGSGRIRSGNERNIGQRMASLTSRGVKVTACATCCRFRGVGRDDLADGVTQGGMSALARLIDDCDRLVTLGM